MSAHLSRLRLFQRHLRSLVWVWVWVWDWVHWHTSPRTRSPSSRHPPFTHYPFPPRSLVCGGQTSPHKPRRRISEHMSSTVLLPRRAQICIRYCSNKQQLQATVCALGHTVVAPVHTQCTLPLALPFFSPSFFHTISLSPASTSA
jgi:hypothetical protein